VLGALVLLPLVVRSPYVIHVAILSGIHVILTLSLNLISGTTSASSCRSPSVLPSSTTGS